MTMPPNALTREQVELIEYAGSLTDPMTHDQSRVYGLGVIANALLHALTQQAQELVQAKRIQRDVGKGEFWYWNDDEHDHLESLICPVVVRPEKIKEWKQEVERLNNDVGMLRDEPARLKQQLAAMTAERDNYLSKWRASADLNKGLLRDYDTSQARVKELEEWRKIVVGSGTDQETVIRMAASEYTKTAVQCWKDKVEQLQATLAARERVIEQQEATIRGYRHSAEIMGRNHDDRKAERDTARQDAARLREALEAHMQLAAKICYAEPELSQYRAMTKQAQRALKGEPRVETPPAG